MLVFKFFPFRKHTDKQNDTHTHTHKCTRAYKDHSQLTWPCGKLFSHSPSYKFPSSKVHTPRPWRLPLTQPPRYHAPLAYLYSPCVCVCMYVCMYMHTHAQHDICMYLYCAHIHNIHTYIHTYTEFYTYARSSLFSFFPLANACSTI